MHVAGPARCFEVGQLIAAALSGAFFLDKFGLGYTTSHSLWHLSSAVAGLLVVR